MAPKYPSKKRGREKRPTTGSDKKASLRRIIKSPGKERKKFHRFLQQTGTEFVEKLELLDSFYSLDNYEKTWEFDKHYLPRPIFKH